MEVLSQKYKRYSLLGKTTAFLFPIKKKTRNNFSSYSLARIPPDRATLSKNKKKIECKHHIHESKSVYFFVGFNQNKQSFCYKSYLQKVAWHRSKRIRKTENYQLNGRWRVTSWLDILKTFLPSCFKRINSI